MNNPLFKANYSFLLFGLSLCVMQWWMWVTGAVYLFWRWQWRRDKHIKEQQFLLEERQEQQLGEEWNRFARSYGAQTSKTHAAPSRYAAQQQGRGGDQDAISSEGDSSSEPTTA